MSTSIVFYKGKYQLTFRGQYVARYAIREEAQAELERLRAITPRKKGSGGKREGAGRKKKNGFK